MREWLMTTWVYLPSTGPLLSQFKRRPHGHLLPDPYALSGVVRPVQAGKLAIAGLHDWTVVESQSCKILLCFEGGTCIPRLRREPS
jgi:hypothetical protein